MINAQSMQNAYDVERPNTVIKLAAYASKTVGQGMEINPTVKKFTFDEALALIALRYELHPNEIKIYENGLRTNRYKPVFRQVRGRDKGLDLMGAVLKGVTRPLD